MHKIGCRILTATGAVFILLGVYAIFFNNTPLFSIIDRLMDPNFWTNETLSAGTLKFKIFTWEFLGMLHVIWGVYLLYTVTYGLMKKEPWAWRCIAISVATLIAVDAYLTFSIKHNSFILVTVFFVLAFSVPLFMTRGVLKKRESA